MRKYLNFPEGSTERREAEQEVSATIAKTYRATGRDKRGPPPAQEEEAPAEEADTSVQFDLEVEGGGSGVRYVKAGGGTSYRVESEEEDWDVSGVGGDLLSPGTRAALDDTEASVQYYSGGEDLDESKDL